jgi:hypothetical protein
VKQGGKEGVRTASWTTAELQIKSPWQEGGGGVRARGAGCGAQRSRVLDFGYLASCELRANRHSVAGGVGCCEQGTERTRRGEGKDVLRSKEGKQGKTRSRLISMPAVM